jgi:DNA polymerase-3 subunit alpha
MAAVTLDDRTARMEVTVFPEAYNRYRHVIAKDALLVVSGGLGYDEFADGYRVTAEQIMDIGEARNHYARRVVMGVDSERAGNGFVHELQAVLEPYCEGDCPVWVEYRGTAAQAALRLGERWRVRPTDELIKRLAALTRSGNVRIEY